MDAEINDQFTRFGATQIAHEMLLEQIYVNTFAGQPEMFDRFIKGLLQVAETVRSRNGSDVTEEELKELRGLISERLQKFGRSTSAEIARRQNEG